jgi:hypothetical protein
MHRLKQRGSISFTPIQHTSQQILKCDGIGDFDLWLTQPFQRTLCIIRSVISVTTYTVRYHVTEYYAMQCENSFKLRGGKIFCDHSSIFGVGRCVCCGKRRSKGQHMIGEWPFWDLHRRSLHQSTQCQLTDIDLLVA